MAKSKGYMAMYRAKGVARGAVPSVGPISTRLDGTQRQVEWLNEGHVSDLRSTIHIKRRRCH